MNKRSEVQFPPTKKIEWCLDLMIKKTIIRSERHRIKLFLKKKQKTKNKNKEEKEGPIIYKRNQKTWKI